MADEEFDLDAELANTLKEINAREEAEETEDQPEEVESDVPETEEEPVEVEEAEDELSEEEPDVEAEKPQEVIKEDKAELRRPPSSWSAKGKAEFSKLPAHIQDEVLKRESDFHNGIQQYREKAEIGDRISRIVQPYEPLIRAQGSTSEQTIGHLLNTAYVLNAGTPEQKQQMLYQIAREYNIDTNGLTQQDERPDYVRQLEQQLNQLQGSIQSQRQMAQQQTVQEAQSSIEQFRNETDESGSPKHLYFDDVRDEMADRIDAAARQGRQLSLQDAYDAAIWARPDIRETLMTAKQQEADAKRKQEQARKAREAKRKAEVNVSTTGTHASTSSKPIGSIEDTMRETLAQLNARDG